jgi:RNA methyltransferase, TrmH family
MIKEITSLQNPYIKDLVSLKEKSKNRKKSGLFIFEGLRELNLALESGYIIETLLFQSDLISQDVLEQQLFTKAKDDIDLIRISRAIYNKLAYRDTTEGVIAVSKAKNHALSKLKFNTKNPLILVAESLEKPGNIGALLRTADAAKLDAVIIANPKADLYNPNCIRSSVGCIFTNKIATDSTENVIEFLKTNKFDIYCATLDENSKPYHLQRFTNPTAIIVGTEATGLSKDWIQAATQNIMIPMQGKIDSMNVSVSAAILIFEAKRQRQFE